MVWKVFAPRFMLAGVTAVVVDVGVAFALFVGGKRCTGGFLGRMCEMAVCALLSACMGL